ncbi:hypothetical protein WR30_26140 [Burkholderia contaminans FFH2055]|uniref:hypothetical protein n=1 Tax=Burkholderia contaminans TaxID=488447 RepID=UPI0006269EE6|nr:hypothetical protein [Burkholderia contaminans]KKL34016.1 hypothetical protein WR30_26140 [Burkholderia contaminans FFH2055]MEB4632203.1 hypothetical protein [Burkholderia contaminans]MEB4639648.1 hypothetical protein [Burkholderia contaminans]MEB4654304.1 hypothetical protein [Burkholderia contaminans]MEB4663407.1 hypothetical protein [Burkholderia contaminans]
MENCQKVIYGLCGALLAGVVAYAGATTFGRSEYQTANMAYWVQATGSIAAILGALWVAGEQHRRDADARQKSERESDYVLNAEIAWLGLEVLNFLNQFIDIKANERSALVISDYEFADLLTRLSWCRQRAKHKGQLAMVGTMRRSLIGTTRIIRAHIARPEMLFNFREVEKLEEYLDEAREASNAATGVERNPQFSP